MLAIEAERFGGPQVLTARQVPEPVAGPHPPPITAPALPITANLLRPDLSV
jgi:hypothetical protein